MTPPLMPKPEFQNVSGRSVDRDLFRIDAASGPKAARVWNGLGQGTLEPVVSMQRERHKRAVARPRVPMRGTGAEQPVVAMKGVTHPEQRGCVAERLFEGQSPGGRRALGQQHPSADGGDRSRMSREAQVRFWEGVGVKFPRATRLSQSPSLNFFSAPINRPSGDPR